MTSESRSRLITATRELLAERGYTGTSPQLIQERAGVGQGSMYHHFAGKPGLAAAALAESGDALLAAAAGSFDGPGSVFDRVAHYLRRERPVLHGCPVGRMTEDPEVMASDALRAPVELALQRLQARISELLVEGQRSGEFSARIAPARLAATIAATVQGGYVLSKASRDVQPFTDAVEGMIELLQSQLAPADPTLSERA